MAGGTFRPLRQKIPLPKNMIAPPRLIAAVESGRGVALVPESLACFVGLRLKIIPLHHAPASFPVGAVRRRGKVSAAVTGFINAARQPEI